MTISMGSLIAQDVNPFFEVWKTPFQVPPFEQIKNEHFMPAYEEGMKLQVAEVEAIVNNNEKPTFENTIAAFEKSGKLFTKVNNVFNALNGANTNEAIQEIAQKTAPMISKHFDEIYLNEKLFTRVKNIYQEKDKLNLTTEQKVVLENYYKDFVRGGANLNEEDKEKFKKINEELEKQEQQINQTVNDIQNILKIMREKQNKGAERVYIYLIPKELPIYQQHISMVEKSTGLKTELFAVNDSKKYDPQNKAQKAKPGKPAIYLE